MRGDGGIGVTLPDFEKVAKSAELRVVVVVNVGITGGTMHSNDGFDNNAGAIMIFKGQ